MHKTSRGQSIDHPFIVSIHNSAPKVLFKNSSFLAFYFVHIPRGSDPVLDRIHLNGLTMIAQKNSRTPLASFRSYYVYYITHLTNVNPLYSRYCYKNSLLFVTFIRLSIFGNYPLTTSSPILFVFCSSRIL